VMASGSSEAANPASHPSRHRKSLTSINLNTLERSCGHVADRGEIGESSSHRATLSAPVAHVSGKAPTVGVAGGARLSRALNREHR
jgi:hypothetical protein